MMDMLLLIFGNINSVIGGTPYDGVPIEVLETVDLSLTVIFIVLSTFGIVLAIVCLIFNFIFRERK